MAKNMLGAKSVIVLGKKTAYYRFDGTWEPVKTISNGTAVLIADIDIITKEISLPRTPKSEIPVLAATELKRSHYLDPASIIFNYTVLREDKGSRTLAVYAAKKSRILELVTDWKMKDVSIVRIIPRVLLPEGSAGIMSALGDSTLEYDFLPAEERTSLDVSNKDASLRTAMIIAAASLFSLAAAFIFAAIAARIETHIVSARLTALKEPSVDAAYAAYKGSAERYDAWSALVKKSTAFSAEFARIADAPPEITFTAVTMREGRAGITAEIRGSCPREDAASAFVESLVRVKHIDARLISLERDKGSVLFRITLSLGNGYGK